MTTGTDISKQTDRFTIPWDLTEWIEKKQLLEWITEEIETLDWSNPELIDYLKDHPAYRPKMMLCLLTLSYACGVFESEGIVQSCYQDEVFRSICTQYPPTAAAVARFRRHNRGLLKWSLHQLFKRACRTKFELGDSLVPAGIRRYLVDAAVTRLDVARQMESAVFQDDV